MEVARPHNVVDMFIVSQCRVERDTENLQHIVDDYLTPGNGQVGW